MVEASEEDPSARRLSESLEYPVVPLKFGTSGRRGKVVDLSQLEIYLNASAELEYLLSLPAEGGGIRSGDSFFFACDLRPSSVRYVPEMAGRGEIAQAVERAIRDAGLHPVNLGCIPTPALAYHALQRRGGCMMVTGSHIPFDMNGYKTYSALGELRKDDEQPINQLVERVRERLYAEPVRQSLFDVQGRFKTGHSELSPASGEGLAGYLRRYTDFYAGQSLEGKRFLVYQHSSVARDLLVEVLQSFGAEVIPMGRSDVFVPIDTENMDSAQLQRIQALADEAWREAGPLDAIVSADGDGDRPLLLGFEPVGKGERKNEACRVRFFPGDLLGTVVASRLGADAVVVPITCNDALDRSALEPFVEPKTKVGSPHVIAGIEAARRKGRKRVCGWEANGGFLLGSDLVRNGSPIQALPTRDALLPILEVLFFAAEREVPVAKLFDELPRRFGRSALLRDFPRQLGREIVQRYSPDLEGDKEACMRRSREELSQFFCPELGFGEIQGLDFTDGIRLSFNGGDVAHIRASGNADEMRIYAVADTQDRADRIASAGVAEPDGILRRLARSLSQAL